MLHIKNFLFRESINSGRGILNSASWLSIGKNNLTTVTGKTLEEKAGLPPKPKKPLTPYFRFMKDIRSTVVKENPNAKIADVTKIIANKWKSVDENSKKKYEDDYKKDQMAYLEIRAKYDNKLSDSEKEKIKHLKQEIHEARERRAFKKRVKDLGKPKRPISAFLRFISNERLRRPPSKELTQKDWLKECAGKWSILDSNEKEKYVNQAKKDYEKYKQELTKWEAKMIKLGNTDVVRHDVLLEPYEENTININEPFNVCNSKNDVKTYSDALTPEYESKSKVTINNGSSNKDKQIKKTGFLKTIKSLFKLD